MLCRQYEDNVESRKAFQALHSYGRDPRHSAAINCYHGSVPLTGLVDLGIEPATIFPDATLLHPIDPSVKTEQL